MFFLLDLVGFQDAFVFAIFGQNFNKRQQKPETLWRLAVLKNEQ